MTEKNRPINIFEGIPTAMDYMPYSRRYYKMVKNTVVATFGEHANMLQATRAMNSHGNVLYFTWFPDLYNTEKETLGQFYRPQFRLAGGNKFADYLHGLTHIRSRSEHTNMGEALVIPDNYYTVGVRYQNYLNTNKDKLLIDCTLSPYEEFGMANNKISYKKLWLMNIRFDTFKYQTKTMTFYKEIYKEAVFKADFPDERASEDFLKEPINPFETRLSYNIIRSIFMDEKFKMFSSQHKAFIHTPIATSIKESHTLIFTDTIEDEWIDKLTNLTKSANPVKSLGEIINTTTKQDDYPQKIAANTAKEIIELFFS